MQKKFSLRNLFPLIYSVIVYLNARASVCSSEACSYHWHREPELSQPPRADNRVLGMCCSQPRRVGVKFKQT